MSHCHSEMKKEIEDSIPSFRLTEETAKDRCIKAIYASNKDDVISINPSGVEYNKMMDIALKPNKYQRKVKSTTIDVYDVLKAFEVNNPATAHAVKKLLASGKRGYKDVIQDLEEAIQSIERAIELESSD